MIPTEPVMESDFRAFRLIFPGKLPIKNVDAKELRSKRYKEVEIVAIEPISSVMTFQAQGNAVQKPQAPVETERPENSNSSAPAAEYVDRTTSVVENSQEKGQAENGDQGKDQQAYHEKIRKAIETMNKKMANSEAVFGIHEDTNRVTIKLVDKNTKEVIKELPPEKTLDMIAKVWEMAGILIDERR